MSTIRMSRLLVDRKLNTRTQSLLPMSPMCIRNYAAVKTCFDQVRAINMKETKPASHVIMDLDGVVLDSISQFQQSHDMYLMRWKKALNKQMRIQVMGMRSKDAGDIVTKELGLPIDGEVYANGIWQYQRELFRKLKLHKGIQELVCYLKSHKIPVALVSSSHYKSFELKTRPYKNLIDEFCHIVLGDDKEVLKGKPHPDLVEVAASRFLNAPKEMHKYVVIDSCISGIKAAKSAGMQTVLYPDRLIPKDLYKNADVIMTNLEKFDPSDFAFPPK